MVIAARLVTPCAPRWSSGGRRAGGADAFSHKLILHDAQVLDRLHLARCHEAPSPASRPLGMDTPKNCAPPDGLH